MPILKIKLSVSAIQPSIQALSLPLTDLMSEYTGKPKSLVTVLLEVIPMTVGADEGPCCLIEVKATADAPGNKERDSEFYERVSAIISELSNVPRNRIFVEIGQILHFGWNGAVLI